MEANAGNEIMQETTNCGAVVVNQVLNPSSSFLGIFKFQNKLNNVNLKVYPRGNY